MRIPLLMACVCGLLVGCSAMPKAGQSPVDAASPPVTEKPGAAGAPFSVTANPPDLPVTFGAASPAAGWRTFESRQLGAAVDYPEDWSVSEQPGDVIFASPQGDTVQLALAPAGRRATQQCTTLTNSRGLVANVCMDQAMHLYSAEISTTPGSGAPRQLLLSTTGTGALDVYRRMLDSVRLLR